MIESNKIGTSKLFLGHNCVQPAGVYQLRESPGWSVLRYSMDGFDKVYIQLNIVSGDRTWISGVYLSKRSERSLRLASISSGQNSGNSRAHNERQKVPIYFHIIVNRFWRYRTLVLIHVIRRQQGKTHRLFWRSQEPQQQPGHILSKSCNLWRIRELTIT